MTVRITIKSGGPYRVEGLEDVELCDADGKRLDLTGKTGISLCRCGKSGNQPYCDSAHANGASPREKQSR
jgi:CDGSH-type Zn-finger protein